ncbi:hypothetical protein G3N55_05615 [Dissulfurirhabdus thermomarina]|uniref:Uncharacterized protein n=1 Tax=Dissulfurirhabdus thermomarina TaxID=1765737 RepID=A0A6N9TMG8_DISTH|nr:hypothetical protein [Dissulfurirhabdus thermomarina]NDY42319.1 hypothetical protein [Dissulfurirhabdus thermomarina]NMX22426.1 hypothetical protein [Dissulfurirhabdus thermomarina]
MTRLPAIPTLRWTAAVVAAVVFSAALAGFLRARHMRAEARRALARLDAAAVRLDANRRALSAYKVLDGALLPCRGRPNVRTWQRVEAEWRDLSFPELVRRLAAQCTSGRIFVPERLSVDRISGKGPAGVYLSIKLRGYYLWPCPPRS